jgi:4-amino-4-deoxychorismate lyase
VSAAVVLRGGQRVNVLDPSDRGLAYGDGVFETLRVHAGAPVWWDRHWARLREGVIRLGFTPPDESLVHGHAAALLAAASPRAVLKLIVTRGAGGRGYAPPEAVEPTVVLSLHPVPARMDAVRLRWCALRWAAQPALAGIKHLNRLEQVLARAEWRDPAIFDGLVLDGEGRVVSATSANVFARLDGTWLTPPVEACGIAGLLRGWVLDTTPDARVAALTPGQLLAADEVFLCNAVRGILPVRALDGREWTDWPATRALRRRLAGAEPAFDDGED